MSGYILTPRAHDDLSEIWDYTAEIWDVEQADRYVRDIVATFQDLAAGNQHGKAINHVRPGYFQKIVGKHLIFYTKERNGIRIVRVLHQQMDLPSRLRG